MASIGPPSDSNHRFTTTTVLVNHADTPDSLAPGDILGGRYTVTEVRGGSGKSGMGIVYILHDGNRTFAAKTFQRRFAQDLGFLLRFTREASAWIRCGYHPNIVTAYEMDIFDAVPYLFIEFVPSDAQGRHSLAGHLAQGRLSMPRAITIAIQICDAMSHATAAVPNLVHRDLKPENILITPEGLVKVTDFGLVRAPSLSNESLQRIADAEQQHPLDLKLTLAGGMLGTPAYMAPEQFERAESVDGAADIYAFGCMFYEMLCGFQPFSVRAESTIQRIIELRRLHRDERPIPLRERLDDCPRALERIINRCMHKKPRRRWPSFAAIAAELRNFAARFPEVIVAPLPRRDPTPHEVATQSRSLGLLEGYYRAIRLQQLREHHNDSPYTFHLALASWFRIHGDAAEEIRQLEKALAAPRDAVGYDAVFRLANHYLDQGRLEDASRLLDGFLHDAPDRLAHVLEPWARLEIARGNFHSVEKVLAQLENDPRRIPLQCALLRAKGDPLQLETWAEAELQRHLDALAAKVAVIRPDQVIGLDTHADREILTDLLHALRPHISLNALHRADIAPWPDLRGYPDFAPDLALLSELFGEIAALRSQRNADPAPYDALAARLGYPLRMPRHQSRDEAWFWSQQPPEAQP